MFQGYEAGAVDFLFKPIDPRLLRSKVGIFIELFRQRQLLAAQVDEMRELQRTSDLLIGVLGHDLRTPLTALVAASETLRQIAGDNEIVKDIGSRVQRSSMRMSRLISQLLDFAASRVGSIPVHPERTDAARLLEDATREFGHVPAGSLMTSLTGDAHVYWDRDRVLQLLSNLIGNALDHGDRSRPVAVRVDAGQAECVAIEVENGGVLPPGARECLFSPFARPRDSKRGTGLGLYIVDQVARAHGGTVEADSDESRTVFRVTLPRRCPRV